MERTRSRYTGEDRARVFAALTESEGNVKRTARNTGVPASTVRDWKVEWAKGGVDAETIEALPAIITDFVEDATRVRDKLLVRLEQLADRDGLTAREIIPAMGMLTDKIRAYKGLDAVREHHHTVEIPAFDELQGKLDGAIKELVAAGQERQRVINEVIDLEPSQYRELQATTEETHGV